MNFLHPKEGDWERFGDESLIGIVWITGLIHGSPDEAYVTLADISYAPARAAHDGHLEVIPLFGFGVSEVRGDWPHSVLLFQDLPELPVLSPDFIRGDNREPLPEPWRPFDGDTLPSNPCWVLGAVPKSDDDVNASGAEQGGTETVVCLARVEGQPKEPNKAPAIVPVATHYSAWAWPDGTVPCAFATPQPPEPVSLQALREIERGRGNA